MNAVRTNAYLGDDAYAISWLANASESKQDSTLGRIEALDVLNAAFVISSA